MKKILLVDDEEAVLDLLAATLAGCKKYQFIRARDGERALEAAYKHHPDLIFLDLMMPKLNGYDVCRTLKQDPTTAGIKVLILTALTQDHEHQRALASGADGYLTKPFSPMALLEKLESF